MLEFAGPTESSATLLAAVALHDSLVERGLEVFEEFVGVDGVASRQSLACCDEECELLSRRVRHWLVHNPARHSVRLGSVVRHNARD
jgi:hypothetical protein